MAINKFGNAKPENILELQDEYSIKLPKEYVEFLQNYNGGIVEKSDENKILIEDLSSYINIDVLYGVETGSRTSDIRTWTTKFKEDLIAKSIIIGDEIMQGFIVMICEGEFTGVYYWDDSNQFEQSTDEENTYWIAEDFSSFIKHLI